VPAEPHREDHAHKRTRGEQHHTPSTAPQSPPSAEEGTADRRRRPRGPAPPAATQSRATPRPRTQTRQPGPQPRPQAEPRPASPCTTRDNTPPDLTCIRRSTPSTKPPPPAHTRERHTGKKRPCAGPNRLRADPKATAARNESTAADASAAALLRAVPHP
jgi:hypothetical protein